MGKRLNNLFYITHINNLPSILSDGIICHKIIEEKNIKFTPIYDTAIVNRRKDKKVPDGRSLWEFANLYFQPRNPMLYRVLNEKSFKEIAILGVRRDVLRIKEVILTDGNAANNPTNFYTSGEIKDILKQISEDIYREWWTDLDGSKRKIMAECLCPGKISPDYIESIYVASQEIAETLKSKCNIPVIPSPEFFFRPFRQKLLTKNLSFAEGDMFYSEMQTLTISVNCIGVMGKGLASRAKYQFPDIYVRYEDLCKKKILQMGRPYLIKREASRDRELADEPEAMSDLNRQTWFLLFPTKDDWRNPADIKGIEKGLEWVCNNYQEEGIKSLALPALGCGLGWLNWNTVGPLMCKYLKNLNIPVCIYLPVEEKTPDELLTKEFLLSS
ncbi:MAG: DarT ssDNA thymidine ADP-ribosyltransferase family protein [Phycisphaerae bacterium]|jgi:hypothetical protein